MDEEMISRLFRVRRTTLQMLKDRGYLVDDSEINMTKPQFVQNQKVNFTKDDLAILKYKQDDSSDQIYVFFCECEGNKQTKVSEVRKIMERLLLEHVKNAILITQNGLNHQAKQATRVSKNLSIEVFLETELLSNITRHKLVPRHDVLPDKEKKDMLKKKGLSEMQLPRILVSDPIARYYAMKAGQVAKITRPSESAEEYVTYRIASYNSA